MVPDTNLSTYESKKVKYEIRYPGDNGGEVTPVPIPNTAVKLSSADEFSAQSHLTSELLRTL
jgi:hypothetical protein